MTNLLLLVCFLQITFLKGDTGVEDELTSEDQQILRGRCDDYVAAQDEETTLTMGNLTGTRIRFCFAYLKSIIKKGGAGGCTSSSSSSSSSALPAQGMERELKTLQSLVQQRDSEIAILVNMVKQGKQVSSKAFSLPPAAAGLLNQGGGSSSSSSANGSNTKSLVVPRPKDLGLLQDANESFQYFRERCPGHEAIEENKKVLKDKYAEAKRMGEKVNQVILCSTDAYKD